MCRKIPNATELCNKGRDFSRAHCRKTGSARFSREVCLSVLLQNSKPIAAAEPSAEKLRKICCFEGLGFKPSRKADKINSALAARSKLYLRNHSFSTCYAAVLDSSFGSTEVGPFPNPALPDEQRVPLHERFRCEWPTVCLTGTANTTIPPACGASCCRESYTRWQSP